MRTGSMDGRRVSIIALEWFNAFSVPRAKHPQARHLKNSSDFGLNQTVTSADTRRPRHHDQQDEGLQPHRSVVRASRDRVIFSRCPSLTTRREFVGATNLFFIVTQPIITGLRETGLRALGDVPWRQHVALFYDTKKNLLGICGSFQREAALASAIARTLRRARGIIGR